MRGVDGVQVRREADRLGLGRDDVGAVLDLAGEIARARDELLLVGARDERGGQGSAAEEHQGAQRALRGLRGVEGLHVGNSVPGLNKLHVVSETQKEGCPSVFVALAHVSRYIITPKLLVSQNVLPRWVFAVSRIHATLHI